MNDLKNTVSLKNDCISKIVINSANYIRPTVLEVEGNPFWYHGIQIRIDKLRDDPMYACENKQLQDLFCQAAKDGFTVANSQIHWTDIQPNHVVKATETAYIKGGIHADTNYNNGELLIAYDANDESNQSLGYIKFQITDMTQEEIDGAKIRLYHKTTSATPRKISIYGISDYTWKQNTITWNNAPSNGRNLLEQQNTILAAQTPDGSKKGEITDLISDIAYYDFDISDYIRTSSAIKDGILSFIIQEQTSGDTPLLFAGYDDMYAPQLIYGDDNEFTFEYLDKAIDFAKKASLKFEILWFGSDTCSLSCDTRVPVWVHSNYQKTLGDDFNRTPLLKKDGPSSITGVYNYIMCKNDMSLREKEANVIKKMFEHVAKRGDTVVIGFQASNEPGVGRLHGGKKTEHCMCDTCIKKKKDLGVTEEEFREITMWEYNNNLSKAVKTSDYSVWTRVNLDESADVEAVSYNEKMRNAKEGTYIDFIGIDHYRKTPSQLVLTGISGQHFAQGKNLPMIMELGQKDNRECGLYLAEDVMATLAGGAYVTIYDASSSDGCEIYTYNQKFKKFSPFDHFIPDLFRVNHMLKKIGYDLATLTPGHLGGNRLVYFNPTSTASNIYRQNEWVGDNKNISFITKNNGIGIAISKTDTEFALLTTKSDTFIIESLSKDDILLAETGYYDALNNWIKEKRFHNIEYIDGTISMTIPAGECLRIVIKEGILNSPVKTSKEEFIDRTFLETLYLKYKEMKQGNYTEHSWTKFQTALKNTQLLLAKKLPTKGEIQTQEALLQKEVDELLEDTEQTVEELTKELKALLIQMEGEIKPFAIMAKINTAKNLIGDPAIDAPQLAQIIKDLRSL